MCVCPYLEWNAQKWLFNFLDFWRFFHLRTFHSETTMTYKLKFTGDFRKDDKRQTSITEQAAHSDWLQLKLEVNWIS